MLNYVRVQNFGYISFTKLTAYYNIFGQGSWAASPASFPSHA